MALITKTVLVCTLCGRQDCDGVIYDCPTVAGSYGVTIPAHRICQGTGADKHPDGRATYTLVSGHGDSTTVELKRVKE